MQEKVNVVKIEDSNTVTPYVREVKRCQDIEDSNTVTPYRRRMQIGWGRRGKQTSEYPPPSSIGRPVGDPGRGSRWRCTPTSKNWKKQKCVTYVLNVFDLRVC